VSPQLLDPPLTDVSDGVVVVVVVVIATSGDCCCTCCAVTQWSKAVDSCDDCLDAGPPDGYCTAEPLTTTTSSTTRTVQSTTTTRTTTTSTTSTISPTTTQSPAPPTAYDERPEPRGDFQNEELLGESFRLNVDTMEPYRRGERWLGSVWRELQERRTADGDAGNHVGG